MFLFRSEYLYKALYIFPRMIKNCFSQGPFSFSSPCGTFASEIIKRLFHVVSKGGNPFILLTGAVPLGSGRGITSDSNRKNDVELPQYEHLLHSQIISKASPVSRFRPAVDHHHKNQRELFFFFFRLRMSLFPFMSPLFKSISGSLTSASHAVPMMVASTWCLSINSARSHKGPRGAKLHSF